jgi:hypothetical protein
MAAKRVDPLKAKAAKQKKIAIGLIVLLVGVLAIQGPKMLKMLKGPQPAAQAAPTGAGPAPAPATAGAPPAAPVAEPAAASELASVPDSDQAPVVDDGQLATFERFSTKDPFTQQVKPVARAEEPAKAEAAAEPTKEPQADGTAAGSGGTTAGSGGTAAGSPDGGFTSGGTTAPTGPVTATTTSIAVNGAAEEVKVDAPFPALEPTFVLVSVAANGKSVEIGVAGGEYANGGKTMKLVLGKKLTLQNTADGRRYELELRSIAGFPLPK